MRKIISIFVLTFTFLITFCLTSCKDSSDIKVIAFSTTKTSYVAGDKMDFSITLSNDAKYDVISCKINNESFTLTEIALTKNKYIISTTLTYSTTATFTLNEITYMDGKTSKTLKVNKIATAGEQVALTNDIKITDISFKSLDNEDGIYANDNIESTITLKKNTNDLQILNFYFVFTSQTGSQEIIKESVIDDKKSNTYMINLVMPQMAGDVTACVTDIDYTKGTELRTMSQSAVVDTFVVNIHDVEVLNARVTPKTSLDKDVNELSYFDSSSSIEVEIELTNKSNLNVTEIVISSSKVNILPTDIKKFEQLEKLIITKTINLDSEISPIKLKLDSISYTKDGVERKLNQTLINEDYYYYNKIITKPSDFDKMKVDVASKRITGRYILANDITLTGTEKYLFNGYTLNGVIEGNGYSLTSSTINTKSLFEKVAEDGSIQNLQINYSVHACPTICNANYGELNNIKLTGPITVGTSESISNIKTVSALCNINAFSGKIRNIEFASQLISSHSAFTLVENNLGEMKIIVINPASFEADSNILYALPISNSGNVNSVLVLVENWFSGLTAEDYNRQNTLIVEYTKQGTYKNIVVSTTFMENIQQFNKILNGPSASSAWSIGRFFEGGLDKLDSFANIIHNASVETVPALAELETLFGFKSRTNWNPYLAGGVSDDIVTDIKEFEKKALNDNLTTGYGFTKYSNSNNSFWRNINGSVSLNWAIKA